MTEIVSRAELDAAIEGLNALFRTHERWLENHSRRLQALESPSSAHARELALLRRARPEPAQNFAFTWRGRLFRVAGAAEDVEALRDLIATRHA